MSFSLYHATHQDTNHPGYSSVHLHDNRDCTTPAACHCWQHLTGPLPLMCPADCFRDLAMPWHTVACLHMVQVQITAECYHLAWPSSIGMLHK